MEEYGIVMATVYVTLVFILVVSFCGCVAHLLCDNTEEAEDESHHYNDEITGDLMNDGMELHPTGTTIATVHEIPDVSITSAAVNNST